MVDEPLHVTTVPGEREGTTVLRLVGPLTLRNLFGFQNDFRALTPPRLVVDMTEVSYIDSAGLGLLVNGHVSAERGRTGLSAGRCVAAGVYAAGADASAYGDAGVPDGERGGVFGLSGDQRMFAM